MWLALSFLGAFFEYSLMPLPLSPFKWHNINLLFSVYSGILLNNILTDHLAQEAIPASYTVPFIWLFYWHYNVLLYCFLTCFQLHDSFLLLPKSHILFIFAFLVPEHSWQRRRQINIWWTNSSLKFRAEWLCCAVWVESKKELIVGEIS